MEEEFGELLKNKNKKQTKQTKTNNKKNRVIIDKWRIR